MKELYDIVEAYQRVANFDIQLALATVVHTEGSSYRRPGARMLVTDTGELIGAISGGCLEGDARRKALMVMARRQPMVVTYDTTDEDDAKVGIGLGCNGIIHILIEPIDRYNATNPVELIKLATKRRQTCLLATAFSLVDKRAANQGTCMLLQPATTTGNLPTNIFDRARHALEQRRPAIVPNGDMQYLLDVIDPIVSLVIAGAGNDVMPLVKLSAVMGWQTTVIDGRPALATRERFPTASQVIVAKYADALSTVAVDYRTAVVLMTHNYVYDLAVLTACMLKKPGYIGVLGPRKKLEKLLNELKQNGLYNLNVEENIFGPVGLDIGAETSEEIALSIAAEIKAVFAQKNGTPLRTKAQPIHATTAVVID